VWRRVLAVYILILLGSFIFGNSPERPLTAMNLEKVSAANPDRIIASLQEPITRYALVRPDGSVFESAYIQFDSLQLIVQADGDGGDTAQRTGMFYYVHQDAAAFTHALDQLEIQPGIYIRHPHQIDYRSDPSRFSRDQQRPLVIAMGKYRMNDRLWRLAKAHLMRLGKYQNFDFAGPSHVGEYVRAFRARALYPLLFVTDLGLVFDSIDLAVTSQFNPDSTDDNNHVLALLQAQDIMSTPVSWVARKIYKNFRAPNLGNTTFGETNTAQGALIWYHRADQGANPLIAEGYRGLLQNL
jgi:hypothetical protein